MLIKIRLFARLREIAGAAELHRTFADEATVGTVWRHLEAEFPSLAAYAAAVSCAVNEEHAARTASLRDGDEVAFLPPVSGG